MHAASATTTRGIYYFSCSIGQPALPGLSTVVTWKLVANGLLGFVYSLGTAFGDHVETHD